MNSRRRRFPLELTLAALALLGLGALASASRASGAVYDVTMCSATPAFTQVSDRPKLIAFDDKCGFNLSTDQHTVLDTSGPVSDRKVRGTKSWRVLAPPGTTIVGFRANRFIYGSWWGTTSWELRTTGVLEGGSGFHFDQFQAAPAMGDIPADPPGEVITYDIDGAVGHGVDALWSVFGCAEPAGDPTQPCQDIANHGVGLQEMHLELDDTAPPVLQLSGSLLAGGTVFGDKTLNFDARDTGGGLRFTGVKIDGKLIFARFNCHEPYIQLVPCPGELLESLSVNASDFGPGTHTVSAEVDDAAQQITTTTATFEVLAPPRNNSEPVLTGPAALGGTLTLFKGDWAGAENFDFEWLRCPGAGTVVGGAGCEEIPEPADMPTYVATRADLGKRIRVKVVASNPGADRVEAFTALTQPVIDLTADTTAPVLSGIWLRPKRYRVAARHGRSPRKKGPRRAVLKLKSSEAGTLSLSVRSVVGKKVARRSFASLGKPLSAGPNKVTLGPKLGKKRVRPGRYVLTISATDAAGNVSAPAKVSFTVLP